jgi:hypothetical protein
VAHDSNVAPSSSFAFVLTSSFSCWGYAWNEAAASVTGVLMLIAAGRELAD